MEAAVSSLPKITPNFFCQCPAAPFSSSDDNEFELPRGTWGVALDDSGIQRKLLRRFYQMAGLDDDRIIIMGKTATDVLGFVDQVKTLMQSHFMDRFIVIADENLDLIQDGMLLPSGSLLLQRLREALTPEQEERLLALVRSANDSGSSIETFKSRAHGYLLKEPVKRGRVLDVLKPWWITRFSSKAVVYRRMQHEHVAQEAVSAGLGATLNAIEALCSTRDAKRLSNRWRLVREKLRILNGIVLMSFGKEQSARALGTIEDALELQTAPSDFIALWQGIRSAVESLL